MDEPALQNQSQNQLRKLSPWMDHIDSCRDSIWHTYSLVTSTELCNDEISAPHTAATLRTPSGTR